MEINAKNPTSPKINSQTRFGQSNSTDTVRVGKRLLGRSNSTARSSETKPEIGCSNKNPEINVRRVTA